MGRENMLRAKRPSAVRVLVPGDLLVPVYRQSCNNIQVSVTVYVPCKHRIGSGVGNALLWAKGPRAVRILVPGDKSTIGRAQHVQVAVFVQVSREHRTEVVGASGDGR